MIYLLWSLDLLLFPVSFSIPFFVFIFFISLSQQFYVLYPVVCNLWPWLPWQQCLMQDRKCIVPLKSCFIVHLFSNRLIKADPDLLDEAMQLLWIYWFLLALNFQHALTKGWYSLTMLVPSVKFSAFLASRHSSFTPLPTYFVSFVMFYSVTLGSILCAFHTV